MCCLQPSLYPFHKGRYRQEVLEEVHWLQKFGMQLHLSCSVDSGRSDAVYGRQSLVVNLWAAISTIGGLWRMCMLTSRLKPLGVRTHHQLMVTPWMPASKPHHVLMIEGSRDNNNCILTQLQQALFGMQAL